MSKRSRRDFLKLAALGFGSTFFTACGLQDTATPANLPLTGVAPPNTPTLLTPSRQPTAIPPAVTVKPRGKNPTPAAAPTPANATLGDTLILGRPTTDSITASLLASADRQIILTYGIKSGDDTLQTNPVTLKANVPQVVEISQLKPDTTYYYRVLAGGVPSAEHSFHTQRAPGSSFTFTIDADPHNRDPNFNGELYATTLVNARNDHPDFHINLGDTFMTEKVKPATYAEAESTFTDMLPYFGLVAGVAPLFLVNGNHEGELGWLLGGKDQDLPIWSTRLRQLYYPNPIPNSFYRGSSTLDAALGSVRDGYYVWTWGDALFIALDPFWYTTGMPKPNESVDNWRWTLGKAQYDWLKTTLETSQAKFRFVFIHHLVGGAELDGAARGGSEVAGFYEWGGKNADGSEGFNGHRPGWGKPIHALLVENHVNAVFHGHDHVFVKQELDGIVYQECPQPSIASYNNTRLAQAYGYTHGDVFSSSGHLRVTVALDQTTVEYVRAFLPQDEKASQKNGQVDCKYFLFLR